MHNFFFFFPLPDLSLNHPYNKQFPCITLFSLEKIISCIFLLRITLPENFYGLYDS